jgi:general secretion pathway protein G
MKSGFTLIEVMVTVAIIGVLASLAGVRYQSYVEKAMIARVIAEMRGITTLLSAGSIDGSLPESLAAIDVYTLDPWDNPYQYLLIEGQLPSGISDASGKELPPVAAPPSGGGGKPGIAKARKDRFLVPINSDFDLYSMGPDGESMPPLQNKASRDDIIRASDGSFFGIAENY